MTTCSVKDCLQDEPAFCVAACPFGLGVLEFIEKIKRRSFNAAYRTYANAVAFPGIVSALCPEPCKGVCPRKDFGGAIELRRLEKAVVDNTRALEPYSYNVPAKAKTVAVVGAGISGLAAALRLASRGYRVTVFERSGQIGGHLRGLLPPAEYLADISRQFMHETYELRLGAEIESLEGLAFDAVYVATGAGGRSFDAGRPGVFRGGSLTGADTMQAIADGLQTATTVEHYLKTGGLKAPPAKPRTGLEIDVSRFTRAPAVVPADGRAYTPEEAVAEAGRCFKCSCDACVLACDLMNYFQKFPKKIADEVHATLHPGSLDGNATMATRLLSTCNQCGLCPKVCPETIDMGELLLKAHRAMREKGAMPWAYHDFYLRDMDFANGEAGLFRKPPGAATSRYAFFPGCQLGASDPRYVAEGYRSLLKSLPDTALALACCGAPAEWAGDEALRDRAHAALRDAWRKLGEPTAVFACPTCQQMFRRFLPEIGGVFLYDLLLEQGLSVPRAFAGREAAVFDPCGARESPRVRETIRALARQAGFSLTALPREGEFAQCCSWGGQVAVAHGPYARYVVKQRTAASPAPYIAYCSNCRDIFAAAGKPVWHILDVLFGLGGPERRPPTATARRDNRLALKRMVLAEHWGENEEVRPDPMKLSMTPELRRKLSDDLILEPDIAKVIEHCESTGRKLLDEQTGNLSGHLKVGNMTFWAEYRKRPDGGFELVNAYGHRMSIEEAP